MLKPTRLAFAFACALAAAACDKQAATTDAKPAEPPPAADLTTDAQKFSYSIGYNIGHQFSQSTPKEDVDVDALKQGIDAGAAGKVDAAKYSYTMGSNVGKAVSTKVPKEDLDLDALKRGLEEAATGLPPRIDDKTRQELVSAEGAKMNKKRMDEQAASAAKNHEAGDKFLAENGKKPGVKTTASGLEYEVETEGKGDRPGPSDSVTVNYKGTLLDGSVFDTTYGKQPTTFRADRVIPGWSEGVQLMTPGSKYKLYIPSKLAYGDGAMNPTIPPGSTLVFEVELISVQKNAPPAPAPVPGKK